MQFETKINGNKNAPFDVNYVLKLTKFMTLCMFGMGLERIE